MRLPDRHAPSAPPRPPTRRDFLARSGGGFGALALAWMTGVEDARSTEPRPVPRADLNGGLHHPARARRVVQLFMSGAASHIDMFDYKPELIRRDGEKWDPGGKVELFQSDPGTVFKSPWEWARHGESGKWMSSLVPHLAAQADEIAFVHSMTSKTNVHGPATFLQNSGFVLPGFPSMGAWVDYGLGSMNDDLPTFVVLPDARGFAPNGPANWAAGFLPARHQGTTIRVERPTPIHDLFPPADPPEGIRVDPEAELATRELIRSLDEKHLAERPGDDRLEARIAGYEMAARLQLSAPEALDLSGESDATRKLYGLDVEQTAEFGRRCLVARRLLQRGVRFVQVWSGADNGFPRRNWDSHEDLPRDHLDMASSMDRGAAALIADLKGLGMLEDTIVVWTTEFGRMPCRQGGIGRDHNPEAFTSWVAGGGFKGGAIHGESDEWGYKVAESPTTVHDLHATILHQLGIDHERLTFRSGGIDRRLTDVHGHVLHGLIG